MDLNLEGMSRIPRHLRFPARRPEARLRPGLRGRLASRGAKRDELYPGAAAKITENPSRPSMATPGTPSTKAASPASMAL
jgi:hypothetical protein